MDETSHLAISAILNHTGDDYNRALTHLTGYVFIYLLLYPLRCYHDPMLISLLFCLFFLAQCLPAAGSDRARMRRGGGAPGAPDERRREPGSERARVLLHGWNRQQSNLFVQQGRH